MPYLTLIVIPYIQTQYFRADSGHLLHWINIPENQICGQNLYISFHLIWMIFLESLKKFLRVCRLSYVWYKQRLLFYIFDLLR